MKKVLLFVFSLFLVCCSKQNDYDTSRGFYTTNHDGCTYIYGYNHQVITILQDSVEE